MEMIGSSPPTPDIFNNDKSSSPSNRFGKGWRKMEVVTRKFFKPLRTLFAYDRDKIRLIDDPSVIKDCHDQYNAALKDSCNEDIDKCVTRLTYTLVHSMQVDDVLHGIQLLEQDLSKNDTNNDERIPDKMYQLALGYYRCEEYNKSVEFLNRCIEKSPNHKKALTLLKKVQAQIKRDEILCAGCAGFTCFAGLLGTFAATRQSDKQRYEKLRE